MELMNGCVQPPVMQHAMDPIHARVREDQKPKGSADEEVEPPGGGGGSVLLVRVFCFRVFCRFRLKEQEMEMEEEMEGSAD